MKKMIAIATCLVAFSSVSHAGWLDAIKSTASVTKNIPGMDTQSLVAKAVNAHLGENATPATVTEKFGNPTVAPFKNKAGDEVWQYGLAGILSSLGKAAAVLNKTVKDLSQTVEITFKDGVVTSVTVVDATTAAESAGAVAAPDAAAVEAPVVDAPAAE